MTLSIVSNGKFIIFRYPKIWAHCSLIIMCLNIGTPKNHHFPFGANGKVVVLGVPILKHLRVPSVRRTWLSHMSAAEARTYSSEGPV